MLGKSTILLLLFTFLRGSFVLAQEKIFVSPSGDDRAAGTFANPFQSIEKAVSIAESSIGDVLIFLRNGRYYLNETVLIRQGAFKSLSIQPYQNEKVIIDAGQRLDLQWKPYKNGIFVAKISKEIDFKTLYLDDTKQILARYPNYDSSAKRLNGTAADAISKNRVASWKHPIGGYIHALQSSEWGSLSYRITGKKSDSTLQLEGGWQINRPSEMSSKTLFVENIFEELDAPNEWFFDRKNRLLYLFPAENIDLANATVIVARHKESFVLKGTSNSPLKNVVIHGLDFVHNARSFMDTKEPLLRSDWCIFRGAALLLDGTENCTIRGCRFYDMDGNAVMISNYNRRAAISGNHIFNIGASAIAFIGNIDAVRSPRLDYSEHIAYDKLDKTPGPKSNNYPQSCRAEDNLIHDIGQIEKQVAGVTIDISEEITINHNTIYNVPRAGINIGDGCWGGHIIEYNEVFNTVLETGDHGAFNSWGRDRYWDSRPNYTDSLVQVHPELKLLDALRPNVLRFNRFRCDHGWDIDLDDGSSNYLIYNNVCLNGGLKLREGFHRNVYNNIMINNSFHPHVWYQQSEDIFEHNIVTKKYFPIWMKFWSKEIDFNLFPNLESLEVARANGTDSNSIASNPIFVNASVGNYTVAEGSPAFTIGFRNFSQDSFGTRSPELKRLAQQTPIPDFIPIQTSSTDKNKNRPVSFEGSWLRSVISLGDRSAFGLPDEAGVIIVDVGQGILSSSGLRDNDVIIEWNEMSVDNVADFQRFYRQTANSQKSVLTIIRNQQRMEIPLRNR